MRAKFVLRRWQGKMVFGDKSLNTFIRKLSLKNLPTLAFKYEVRELEVGAVHAGEAFVEYGGAHITIVEV